MLLKRSQEKQEIFMNARIHAFFLNLYSFHIGKSIQNFSAFSYQKVLQYTQIFHNIGYTMYFHSKVTYCVSSTHNENTAGVHYAFGGKPTV